MLSDCQSEIAALREQLRRLNQAAAGLVAVIGPDCPEWVLAARNALALAIVAPPAPPAPPPVEGEA
jgi:long-subunit acyl-CoA synthetase (AMP-forming)